MAFTGLDGGGVKCFRRSTGDLSRSVRSIETGKNAGEQTISKFLTHVFYFSLPLSVNNAGQGLISVFECIPIETAQNLFDTNFFGVMRVLKAVLPGMKARQKGRIINVSSIIGVNGHPFSEIYSASKFALEGLTESLAPTLRKFNIR